MGARIVFDVHAKGSVDVTNGRVVSKLLVDVANKLGRAMERIPEVGI